MVLQDLAVEGGGVDLVKAEVRAQEVPALGELAAEGPSDRSFTSLIGASTRHPAV